MKEKKTENTIKQPQKEQMTNRVGILFQKKVANRKEDNDQESIQLTNTFHQRHQRERRAHLKQ